jgi:copper chaperone NosL
MSKQIIKRTLPIALTALAALLLLASLRLPLWHMRLEAPQYRDEEALKIAVFPNRYGGDMREITVLNQYIGVHVPRTLPQFAWLPFLVAGGAALGVAASFLNVRFRRSAIGLACAALAAGLLTAAVQAKFQMHDIGHKRDQRTVLAGMHDFTPPFLGTSKIAQFTVTSSFGLGAWLIGAAMALQIGAAWASRKTFAASVPCTTSTRKCCCKESIETPQFAYQI